jgi:hypothetical protein
MYLCHQNNYPKKLPLIHNKYDSISFFREDVLRILQDEMF